MDPIPIKIDFNGQEMTGDARPYPDSIKNEVPFKFNITLNNKFVGVLECTANGWEFENKNELKDLADIVGNYIVKWYE